MVLPRITLRLARRMAVVFVAGLLALPLSASGQGMIDGFKKNKGNLDLALSYSWERYDEFYVGDQLVSEPGLGEITTQSVSLYAAYGLSSRFDVIVNLPFISAKASNNSALDESSLQDLALCVKGLIVRHTLANGMTLNLLGSVGVMAPTSRYAIEAPVAIGHRSTHLDGRLVGQIEFGNGAFAAVQSGYIWRSDVTVAGASVEVPGAFDTIVRAGYGSRAFYADLWANFQQSQPGTDIGPGVPFPSNAISFIRVGGTLYTPITAQLGIGLGAGYTVSGENVGKAFRMSGGVIYRVRG
ncbi:MAG: hypothetical protein SH809_07050 [Rhodothermales bacterium]|nr:hypothetical protein [Rhodothermales bacterium]